MLRTRLNLQNRTLSNLLQLLALFVSVMIYPLAGWAGSAQTIAQQHTSPDLCPRPVAGSVVANPKELRSQHGILKLDLEIRNFKQKNGAVHYCYLLPDGTQAPTLRLHPGDQLILHLKNKLTYEKPTTTDLQVIASQSVCTTRVKKNSNVCGSGVMNATSTNLHFHGFTVPPICHQDDVLNTSIQPEDGAFEYRFTIPKNEAPGLYWYHPHIHGFSSKQVQGGASGALIIEGIENVIPELAGLPERILVIRDQELVYPNAPPSKSEPVMPKSLAESDGDAANNGTGFGKPAKDLSLNFIPVPFPDYRPAQIKMKPNERQLWRVLNASSVTYLNLALLYQRKPQQLGIVAIDGVPGKKLSTQSSAIAWVDHIGIPPGSRVEFIMNGPPAAVPGLLVTRTVDTGPGGENDPNRALASIVSDDHAAEPESTLPKTDKHFVSISTPWLKDIQPVRVRKLYFSEKLSNSKDPNSPTEFYITVDGQQPKPFDPRSGIPNITTRQGDVEDWIIENRSNELHAFHIHQIHFLVMDWSGIAIDEPFLRDTVNIPYFKSQMLKYPSVRLRMDFRNPNTVGTFVYHCHLLEHEDGGMMGTIRVLPRSKQIHSQ